MNEFPTIIHMLRTVYNAEDGLSYDVSVRLYQRAATVEDNKGKLHAELLEAFSKDDLSWRQILCNEEYEVADIETESEAREYARKLLWDPLFKKGGDSE